ncbi:MAG: polymer-forming cytoskeletal protein [Spirochaetaceae bacterium]|jgi:cytoskeletal protein CcmA (bactofilin family)|nr:polymer-forming cytoskeletal protein [Spirochaetaceae bacterium]
MAQKVNRSDYFINTIIGPNTSVWGDVEVAGFARVDGAVHGDVTAKGRIVIGEKACLKSSISGTAITIGGIVYGNVIAADRLTLLSTSLIIGDIITRRIQIDNGGIVHGKIVVCKDDEKWQSALAEHHDAESVHEAIKQQQKSAPSAGKKLKTASSVKKTSGSQSRAGLPQNSPEPERLTQTDSQGESKSIS